MEEAKTEHTDVEDGALEEKLESALQQVTRAELQRTHTRVAARLGDVASNGFDTIASGPQPED